MKIQLVFRNFTKLHSIHLSMINDPPEGVEYIVPKTKKFLKKFYPIYHKYRNTKLFSFIYRKVQNIIFSESIGKDDIDLIYYIQYVPNNINIDKPYIVDFEHAMGFTDFLPEDKNFFENKVKDFLEANNCKGIIAMSEAAKESLRLVYGKGFHKIEKKITVIYPTLHINKSTKKANKKFKFLFVGNQIYRKGLHELLQAFIGLPESKTELIIVSDIPKELKRKYIKNNIKYFDPVYSYDEILKKFFCKADVFVMPTHSDTYGMVYMDAMSCGLPVIATNQFAIPELVTDKKTGFVLNTDKQYLVDRRILTKEAEEEMKIPEKKLIYDLQKTMEYCIDNQSQVKQMGAEAQNLFDVGGKFSIDVRNKLLKKVYEEALEV